MNVCRGREDPGIFAGNEGKRWTIGSTLEGCKSERGGLEGGGVAQAQWNDGSCEAANPKETRQRNIKKHHTDNKMGKKKRMRTPTGGEEKGEQ